MRRKQQTAGQVGLACINANHISDRQQEPVGNREGVMLMASKEAMESPSFRKGEDVNNTCTVVPIEIGVLNIVQKSSVPR